MCVPLPYILDPSLVPFRLWTEAGVFTTIIAIVFPALVARVSSNPNTAITSSFLMHRGVILASCPLQYRDHPESRGLENAPYSPLGLSTVTLHFSYLPTAKLWRYIKMACRTQIYEPIHI